ncbi:hypothetical protein GcM1_230007 [Golovinomyces cichoracearum]|uniref:Uncharacterized protein n=1 Tax=Golovinomyces cichoracearum TaxID=62708 RepID=A0A420IMY9_9PEZI|nr:hypothetical protein GcM1_230007 [Golovinomyces cichoracearum]
MSTINLNKHTKTQSNSFINSNPYSDIQPRSTSQTEQSEKIPTRCLDRAYWISLLESSSLNDEDKLLVRLRKIDRLPWKEVQAQFNRKCGTEAQQGKLQM